MPTSTPEDDSCIAVAGEALIDLISRSDGSYLPCLGGAPYNLARALARQGLGTLYLNPLSGDRFGRALAQKLEQDGVRLAHVEPVLNTTSLAVVNLSDSGHPDYAFYREGVADRQVSAAGLNQACARHAGLKMVCTGALALDPRDADIYVPWLRARHQAGQCVVVDANLRPSVFADLAAYRSHVLAVLAHADLIKISDEDLLHLGCNSTDALSAARELLARTQATVLALTLGAKGAWLLTRNNQWYAREMDAFTVVDTVGAGDCFLAGLLAALLNRQAQQNATQGLLDALGAQDFQAMLRHALANASLCVQQQGCTPATWAATLAWSQRHPVLDQ